MRRFPVMSREPPAAQPQSRARQMYDNGISCLGEDDLKGALEYFRLAWQYRDQLTPQIRCNGPGLTILCV